MRVFADSWILGYRVASRREKDSKSKRGFSGWANIRFLFSLSDILAIKMPKMTKKTIFSDR